MVAQNLVSQTAPMSIQSYVRQLKYMDQLDHRLVCTVLKENNIVIED